MRPSSGWYLSRGSLTEDLSAFGQSQIQLDQLGKQSERRSDWLRRCQKLHRTEFVQPANRVAHHGNPSPHSTNQQRDRDLYQPFDTSPNNLAQGTGSFTGNPVQ